MREVQKSNDPDALLKEAARLTLRLALRCEWEGCEPEDDDDPDSCTGLYDSIGTLLGAYVRGPEGEGQPAEFLLSRFAAHIADVIAKEPSLLAAVAAHLAAKTGSDL